MEIILKPHEEYRIEVDESQRLKIMVMEGYAEVKGQELLNEKWYIFKNINTFIFSFSGCKLKIDGHCNLQYLSKDSNVPRIFSFFYFFYSNNFNYKNNKTFLVIGEGRTSFCTTVINYFVRTHKKVLFTEIDLKKGNIFPGSLSSIHIDSLIEYTDNIKLKNPLSFFYGSLEIKNNELYFLQLERLKEAIDKKKIEDIHLILAPEGSMSYYNSVITNFNVDKVVILGDERKNQTLKFNIPKLFIKKTGYTQEYHISKSISYYFNGVNNDYTPYSFNVKKNWTVLRIGEDFLAPESALPLGSARKVDTLEPKETEAVDNRVLGISEATEIDKVASSPVVGYVLVINQPSFKILCTQPKLPKYSFLIQGDLKFVEP